MPPNLAVEMGGGQSSQGHFIGAAAASLPHAPQVAPGAGVIVEDSRGELHERIRAGQYPISLKFLMWQDSNIGNYIEFKIQVTYHEGHENASG